MADDISLLGVAVGFLGGILGGLSVNIVSIHYQKRVDRKYSSDEALVDFKTGLIGRLNGIVIFWSTESGAPRFSYKSVQNKFDIFAQQIAKDISNPPAPLRPEVSAEFQDLIVALNRVRDALIQISGYRDQFLEDCKAVIEKVEHIKALDTEWFESG